MPLVSVTRLRIRSWMYLPAFFFRSFRIGNRAKAASGNLGVRILNDHRRTFWTCTAWESEAEMRAFMLAPPHGPAMRKLLEWCDEAAVVHWSQAATEMPTWTEAHERMQREGRPSKVNHPSEDHNRYAIAAPRSDGSGQVKLK